MSPIQTAPFMPQPKHKADTEPRVERLQSKAEAAKLLNCCRRTIDNLHAAGKLPFVKLGTRALIDPADLRRLIDESKS